MEIRSGTSADAALVLDLLDGAVRWLVARGQTGQWGTEPFSTRPDQVARVNRWAGSDGLWVIEESGVPLGAMLLGAAHDYVPPPTEPELYLMLLVTERTAIGRGVGRALVEHARQQASQAGLRLLRVDCWAGGDGALVRQYQSLGFTPTERFTVGDWPGQILTMRID